MNPSIACVAFEGGRCIASGELREVALKVYEAIQNRQASILMFDAATSELIDVDFRGSVRDVKRWLDYQPPAGGPEPAVDEKRPPGRPKLGVVAREVTLLPRHWEWLNLQPGGASVALRKLVEDARRVNRHSDRVRRAKEAAYRFLSAVAGNEAGFEEATRALFSGNEIAFAKHILNWPPDVREHAARLAARVFEDGPE